MRELFVWLLKLSAWVTPVLSAWYGYTIGSVPPVNAGVFGAFVGFIVGLLGWLFYAGLADLADTIWDNQRVLSNVTERLEKISKTAGTEEAEEAAQLATLVSKVTAIESSIGDLHEGLSDVLEDAMKKISGIKDAVTTTPPKEAPAPVPSIDLSSIATSNNR